MAICAATKRRPEYLERLLRSLVRLNHDDFDLEYIIVDNDPVGSAMQTIEALTGSLHGLIYEVEPTPGIAAARNRLVDISRRIGADYIAFVDDDEEVTPDWATKLLEAASTFNADIVSGPVVPVHESGTPSWVINSSVHMRPTSPSGTSLNHFATNNVLISLRVLASLPVPFDNQFGLIGGSDTHLSMRLAGKGARMVWCADAIVTETIPLSRSNFGWICRRSYRSGYAFTLQAKDLGASRPQLTLRAVKNLAVLLRALVALPLSLLWGKEWVMRSLSDFSRGLGALSAFTKIGRYEEYARNIHGR